MNFRTPAVHIFLILCIIVSVPGVFSSSYYEVFNSELSHEYWWQQLTMPFQHGTKNAPIAILIHLALNMGLLLTAGKMTESMLGTKRFILVSLAAWLGFYASQQLSGIWINGSSGIIWAYSPFLLLIREEKHGKELASQAKGLLIIMWAVVTLAMGFIPFLFNPNHTLLHTFFYGNLFHFTATGIGFIFFLAWEKSLRNRT